MKCGYEKYVQRRDGYVATLKGIYLVMWRLMEPLKARRFKRREREAMAEWHALGMEEFVAASQPVNPAEHAPASLRPGNEPATGALGYEVSLAKDEVRFERSPGKLIVRGGSATFAQFLLESWPQWLTLLMWAGFSAIALTLVARVAFMPPNPRMRFPWSFLFYACVTVIFFGQALFGLYMTLQRRRRPVTIEASESGLSFRSTTTSTKPGSIPRSHIQAINVMVTNTRGFRRVYGIKVHPMAGNPLVLIESRDEEVLKKVQKEISLAMGLEAPDAAADIVAGKSA